MAELTAVLTPSLDEAFLTPWLSFSCGTFSGLVKHLVIDRSFQIFISDFKSVYRETLGESALLQRCKACAFVMPLRITVLTGNHFGIVNGHIFLLSQELNPDLEVTAAYLLAHLSHAISVSLQQHSTGVSQISVEFHSSDLLLIKLEAGIAGVPFLWEFKMMVQAASDVRVRVPREVLLVFLTQLVTTILLFQFYSQVTLPTLVMLAGLKKQQEDLLDVLRKKDEEIADYKALGCRVSRSEYSTFSEVKLVHRELTLITDIKPTL